MAKPAVSRAFNAQNLEFFLEVLRDFPHFVFYGTLLGLVRDGDIIENDDDIDFCIDLAHKKDLVQIIRSHSVYHVREMEPDFIQVYRTFDRHRTVTDFYLYQDCGDFLSWRWSFEPSRTDTSKNLRMDRSMVLPTSQMTWNGHVVWVPAQPLNCVKWIYGDRWQERIAKNRYKSTMVNNRPFHQYF